MNQVDAGREWAHPRSRGEHLQAVAGFIGGAGSSPLTRGAHLLSSKFSSLTLILHTASRSRERARS